MCTILILEDDKTLNQNISDALVQQKYTVISCHTGTNAKDILQKKMVDLIILDINLPDENGFQFCTWLKSKYMVPVIFVSGRNLEDDILNGYDLGADDYITKPFSMKILLKKINVILTRHCQPKSIYDDGYLKINFETGKIEKENIQYLLTPTEYHIVKKLVDNQGKLLTYAILLDSLWENGLQITDKHTLAVNINRLRKKIENDKHSYISNVYGLGYLWKSSF